MPRLPRSLLAAASLAIVGCGGPRDVIPTAPAHPADPDSPIGAAPIDAGAPAEPEEAGHEHAPPAAGDGAAILAAEQAAYQRARPVFETYCAKCHASSGAKATKERLDHFKIDTYPFGGHHAVEIGAEVREVLGVGGGKATMPADRPGAVQGAELDRIVEWSKAYDRSHAAGLHQHEGQGHGHGGHH